ncbi:uncharacterized protein F5891DRAFT_979660 [Suillus fuscotomentosus]|uniref:Uncharacterized protein n=1 Tax=Suillus fuscotomentosus TaxID=1912939 RepID=A0AAD4HMP2_9AGAM|nr:uncharacterized protein F5891DRAFT_979660 [Suillus fuscotomentosus]KAG1901094.1 hypothetical protein F5891DRAFT_979660 [Suillus fuscotomentosus]
MANDKRRRMTYNGKYGHKRRRYVRINGNKSGICTDEPNGHGMDGQRTSDGTEDAHADTRLMGNRSTSSAVPSEQAFSSGGITLTVTLQLLKGAYRNRHLSAAAEAEGHAASLDMYCKKFWVRFTFEPEKKPNLTTANHSQRFGLRFIDKALVAGYAGAPVNCMALYSDEDDEDGDTHMDPNQGDSDSQSSRKHRSTRPRVKLAQSLISIHPVRDLVAPPSNEHALLPLPGAWSLDARLTEHDLKKPHRPMCSQSVHLHTSLLLVQSPLNAYLVLPPSANCLLIGALQLSLQFLPVTNCPPLINSLCHSLCPRILLSQIRHLLPLLVQADLTLVVPHLFNAANLETVHVHQDAVVLAQEVLGAVLWTYHTKKVKIDKGYFPDIFLKGNSMYKEHVSAAAAKLLKTGEYLQLSDSSELGGNLVVLKEACLSFYYGNGKKALKLTDECQHQIPVNGLILVATVAKNVLSSFHNSGTDKSIDKLMDIPKRRVELEEMLREWAKEGMIGELCNDSDSAADSEDINIIIYTKNVLQNYLETSKTIELAVVHAELKGRTLLAPVFVYIQQIMEQHTIQLQTGGKQI